MSSTHPSTHPLLDHPCISERYFYPRRAAHPNPSYVEVEGARLGCWRSEELPERPVLVYFHGNGEVVADWVDLFEMLSQQLGLNVFLSEYRGYGMSTGAPALAQMMGDLDTIASSLGVPTSEVIVFGRSVGSIYAIEWVRRFPDTRGLLIESGINDVHQRLRLRVAPHELGCSEEELLSAVSERLDHSAKLAAYAGPSLFLHAINDQLVTVDHARANAQAAQQPTLRLLPRGGHNDIFAANTAEYLEALASFLAWVS